MHRLLAVILTIAVLWSVGPVAYAEDTLNAPATDATDVLDIQLELSFLVAKLQALSQQVAEIQRHVADLTMRLAPTQEPEIQTPEVDTETPLFVPTSLDGLEDYLNKTHSTVFTPLGTLTLTYKLTVNKDSRYPDDIRVEMNYAPDYPLSYFDRLETLSHSMDPADVDNVKQSLRALKSHAEAVYTIVIGAAPGKKIRGMYFDSWWQYPLIFRGYTSTSDLTWQNYSCVDTTTTLCFEYDDTTLTRFHFTPQWDSHKFD